MHNLLKILKCYVNIWYMLMVITFGIIFSSGLGENKQHFHGKQ